MLQRGVVRYDQETGQRHAQDDDVPQPPAQRVDLRVHGFEGLETWLFGVGSTIHAFVWLSLVTDHGDHLSAAMKGQLGEGIRFG